MSTLGPAPPAPPASWRTWANAVTVLRLMAAPACAVAILSEARLAAGLLFGLAVVTDLVDGPLARRRGEATAFGGLLDHATDATFVSLGLAALACQSVVPTLLPVLVPLAFLQYMLDSRALAGAPLRASFLGRWNGIAYFVALGVPVVRDALSVGWLPDAWVIAFGWVLVTTTIISMSDRAIALLTRRVREP